MECMQSKASCTPLTYWTPYSDWNFDVHLTWLPKSNILIHLPHKSTSHIQLLSFISRPFVSSQYPDTSPIHWIRPPIGHNLRRPNSSWSYCATLRHLKMCLIFNSSDYMNTHGVLQKFTVDWLILYLNNLVLQVDYVLN